VSPEIARVYALRERRARDAQGQVWVEGVRFVKRAIASGARIERLIWCPEAVTAPTARAMARRIVARRRARGTPIIRVTPEVFATLSQAHEPSGIGAVVRQRWSSLPRAPGRGVWLCLESLRSPGNLGTILRTAEATGVRRVLLLGDAVDPHHPVAVRATMGSLFAQRFVRTDARSVEAWAKRHRIQIVGTHADARTAYDRVRYGPRRVLVIGAERQGMSPAQRAICDRVVRIPMVGTLDSLNVAVATGVLLYDAFRRGRSVDESA